MRADPHIGLLHRATEKLAETKTWIQALPTWTAGLHVQMSNEHAYCLAVERCLASRYGPGAVHRVMFDEITRLLNHRPLDRRARPGLRAMTMFIYAFRERETC